MWYQDNDLSLKVIETKEMIVDYRKRRTEHAPILIVVAVVDQVESFKFLGVHITNKLSWSKHTSSSLGPSFLPSRTSIQGGVKYSSHPSHRLFFLLLHGKRYWSAKSRSKRLLDSFYP